MSDANVTNSLEAGFLPSNETLKRYKEIAPSLADRLEKAVQEARALSYLESHHVFLPPFPSKGTSIASEKIVYVFAGLALMAPLSVLVSILYLIFAK